MKAAIKTIMFFSFLILPFFAIGQELYSTTYLEKKITPKNIEHYSQTALRLSKKGDAYFLMNLRAYLGANNVIIKKTGNQKVIAYQKELIDNIMSTAQRSKNIPHNESDYLDNFKGWVSKVKTRSYHKEVPLYESYSFFYIAQFLYMLKKDNWIDQNRANKRWWKKALHFLEQNEWTKWYERSEQIYGNHYSFFLRSRTHMGAHWAGVAMYLHKMTKDKDIKKQTALLQRQYDTLLKRNLNVKNGAYIWHSTYDNVKGTYGLGSKETHIQDMSHGNHVVAYIVAAYEFGDEAWSKKDIERLCNTVKNVYNAEKNRFYDNLNGTPSKSRPGWGNFVGDGWIKLAQYDDEVKEIFKQFVKTPAIHKYFQELQLKATLLSDD